MSSGDRMYFSATSPDMTHGDVVASNGCRVVHGDLNNFPMCGSNIIRNTDRTIYGSNVQPTSYNVNTNQMRYEDAFSPIYVLFK